MTTQEETDQKTKATQDNLRIELKVQQAVNKLVSLSADLTKRIDAWEETMYCIMHNIKKSQFLYAHYPDDWVANYLDVKEGIKHENKLMNQKIEVMEKTNDELPTPKSN